MRMQDWKSFFWKMRRPAPNTVVSPQLCILWAVGLFLSVSRQKTREAYHISPYRLLDVCRMHDFYLHLLSTWTHVSSNKVTSRYVSCYPCLTSRLKLAYYYCFVGIIVSVVERRIRLRGYVLKSEHCLMVPKNQRC